MSSRFFCALALLCIAVVVPAPVDAKGPVVRLVLSGPDLLEAVEVTDADAIDVSIHGATFIERERRPQERTVASPVAPYQIEFFVDVPRQGEKMMYVVFFVWDNAQGRGLVYFPGPSDAWYRRNMATVALPTGGSWFFAEEAWGRAIQRAIFMHNDPLG